MGLWRKVVQSVDALIHQAARGYVSAEYAGFGYGMSAAYPAGGNLVAREPDNTARYLVFRIGVAGDF